MVSIEENIDTDALADAASDGGDDGGGGGVSVGGGPDPGDVRVDIDDEPEESDPIDDSSDDVNVSGGPDPGDVRVDVNDGPDTGGQESVNETTDPDTGDTTTTRLRDDAESDPINSQTEDVDIGPRKGGRAENVDPAQIRRDIQAERVRQASMGGGGRAGGISSAEATQTGRNVIAGRVDEASAGGGGRASNVSSRDVTVTQVGGGPEPGDVTAEPGRITVPVSGDGPRPTPGQGIEDQPPGMDDQVYIIDDPRPNRGEFRGTKREIAQLIEGLVLDNDTRGTLDEQDIAVVETDGGLGVRMTFSGVQERWQVGSVSRSIGRDFQADRATTARVGALGAIDEAVETQVGISRGITGGPNPGDVRVSQTAIDAPELELGEDYTIEPTFGQPGQFTAELTESRRRLEAERAFERQLAQSGPPVDLDPQSDLRIDEETGQLGLAESGRGKVETRYLSSTVEDVERFLGSGDLTSGPVAPEKQGADLLTPDDPSLPTNAYLELTEDLFGGARDFVSGEYEQFDESPGGRLVGETGRTYADIAEGGLRGGLTIGQMAAELPARAYNLPEARTEAINEGQFMEFNEQLLNTVGRAPAVAASGIVGSAARNPSRFTGEALGSLAGSSLAMRAFPRSRWLIQPGEEIAGRGGFAVTRRVGSERTAQRLFPNKEPLIFSEEAALRLGRRLGGRAQGAAARARRGVDVARGDRPLAPSPRQAELIDRFRPGGSTGTFNPETELTQEQDVATGGVSEPLGSRTESILDVTTDIPAAELPGESAVGRQRTTGGRARRPGELPLFEEIRSAGDVRAFLRGEERVGDRPISPRQVEGVDELAANPRFGGGGPFQVGFGRTAGELRSEVETESEEFTDYSQLDEPFGFGERFIGQRQELFGEYEGESRPFEDARGRQEAAARPSVETEGMARGRARFEPAIVAEPFAFEGLGMRQQSIVRAGAMERAGERGDLASELAEMGRLDTPLELELGDEFDTEFASELMFDTEFELRREFEFETEGETEFEIEAGRGDERPREPDELLLGPRPGFSRTLERDLINPITGE